MEGVLNRQLHQVIVSNQVGSEYAISILVSRYELFVVSLDIPIMKTR